MALGSRRLRGGARGDPGATTEASRTVTPGTLYVLGVVYTKGRAWTALFARGLDHEPTLDAILIELQRGAGKEAGLLVTTSRVPRSYKLPRRHQIARLNEVASLGPDGLRLVPDLIEARFGGVKRRSKGDVGRPSYREDDREIFRLRRRHFPRIDDDIAEAEAVLEELRKLHPNAEDLPTLHTVRNDHLGDLLEKHGFTKTARVRERIGK